MELFQKENQNNTQILLDIYKIMNKSIPNLSIFIEELSKYYCTKNMLKNLEFIENDIKSEFKSHYINLHNKKVIFLLDNYTFSIQIEKIGKKIIFSINQKFCIDFYENFNKDIKDFKIEKNSENNILSENLFLYCKLKKYEKFCIFMKKEDYHPISICKDLLSLKYEDELSYYIYHILLENDLLNNKNEDNMTIFHILAKIKNDLSFYKENNLKKYNISNIFDNSGNTPLFYACKELNMNFIEFFSNYSFSSINNNPEKVNYSLFLETNNETNPLKSLYFYINKKDKEILKLIIDISINTKIVYILYIISFLIENYKPANDELFKLPYLENLKNEDYIRKVIGLYSFYGKELKGGFSNKEFEGNNPIFYCIKNNNFEFLFYILLKEKTFEFNSRNKDGKNLIHLIIEKQNEKSWNKKEILKKSLEAGFDFNIKDNKGMLPIDYAYLNKENEIIEILINKYEKNGINIPEDKTKYI